MWKYEELNLRLGKWETKTDRFAYSLAVLPDTVFVCRILAAWAPEATTIRSPYITNCSRNCALCFLAVLLASLFLDIMASLWKGSETASQPAYFPANVNLNVNLENATTNFLWEPLFLSWMEQALQGIWHSNNVPLSHLEALSEYRDVYPPCFPFLFLPSL